MAAISSSNTAFALDLFRTLSQAEPSGNIFVSPLSISSAMAMVYLGARGNTAAQMAQVSSSVPWCTSCVSVGSADRLLLMAVLETFEPFQFIINAQQNSAELPLV